jgi:hypothetical protein
MHRLQSRLLGLLIMVFGVGLTLAGWLSAMLSGTFMKGLVVGPLCIVMGLYYVVTGASLRRSEHRWSIAFIVMSLIAVGLSLMNYAMLRDGDMKLPVRLFQQIPKEHYSTVGYLFFENERGLEESRKYLTKRHEEITGGKKNCGREAGLDEQMEEYRVAIEFYNAAVARLKPTPASPTSPSPSTAAPASPTLTSTPTSAPNPKPR